MMIGKLVATSIIQGGPGFPVLLPAAYRTICHSWSAADHPDEIPDPLIHNLLDQVSEWQFPTMELRAMVYNVVLQFIFSWRQLSPRKHCVKSFTTTATS